MGSTAIDSLVLRGLFATEAMRRVFSDESRIQRYLDVEAALARAEARAGIIPDEAAAEICRHASVKKIDIEQARARTELAGSPVIPVVEQLVERCGRGLGQYCHWGATTQDITDTATVLQIRDALALLDEDLAALSADLGALAPRFRDTPMAARSKLQHAVPITFGFKAAQVLAALERDRARLAELRPRVMVGQFGGAAGTLASLGGDGLKVQALLMEELRLGQPEIAWHTHRDRFAETGCWLAVVTATLAKFATDIKLMMQTEVGEAFEPFESGRGSSSTMPQKRNPVSCNYIIACAAMVRRCADALVEAMVADHERSSGPWETEWIAIPEAFLLASGALAHARTVASGLELDSARMRANLSLTNGLVASGAVMMGLAPYLGRERAHDLVYRLCRDAVAQRRPLADLLNENDEVSCHLDHASIARLADPANYLGLAREMVDSVLEQMKKGDSHEQ